METRFYLTESLNLPAIAAALVVQYQSQGFETQQLGTETQTIVQLRKESTLRAITGLNKALTISLERRQSGVLVTVGAQNWADQIVAGTVGLAIHPLLVTAAIGAVTQNNVVHDVLASIDHLVHQQLPYVQVTDPPSSGSTY